MTLTIFILCLAKTFAFVYSCCYNINLMSLAKNQVQSKSHANVIPAPLWCLNDDTHAHNVCGDNDALFIEEILTING